MFLFFTVMKAGKIYFHLVEIVFKIFNERNLNYQLRHTSHFSVPAVRSVYNGSERLSFLGPKTWNIVSTELKEVKTSSA